MDIPFAIASVQAASKVDTVSALSSLDQGLKLVPDANSLYATPSATVTLGAIPAVPLSYNSAGVFDSTSTIQSTLAANAANNLTSVIPRPAVAVVLPVGESASSVRTRAVPAVPELVIDTVPTTSGPPIDRVAVLAAQAQTNIASDPSYASIATALYLNAASFRSRHDSGPALPNLTRVVQPIGAVPAVNRIQVS